MFTELYPLNNLIPKHHFMIHYPACIRQIGPLVHVWTMRYEAKHKFFKSSIKNVKNITKSLAKKHQLAIAYHWESLAFKGIESGPVKTELLNDLEHGEIISDYLQLAVSTDVTVTPWVKWQGMEYRTGLVVCLDLMDEIPVFGQIDCIFLFRGDIYFLFFDMESIFVEHVHAYHVVKQDSLSLIKPDALQFHKPFDLQMSASGNDTCFYVVLDSYVL